MNKNIEVINENLWAVNQHYVKNGYIKELSNLEGFNPELHDANLTNDGILILNTCSPVYDTLKKITVRVMEKADDELQVAHKSMQSIHRQKLKNRQLIRKHQQVTIPKQMNQQPPLIRETPVTQIIQP